MKEKGRNEMTQLLAKLFSLEKSEDAEKAAKDPNYMRKLLKDYGLAEGWTVAYSQPAVLASEKDFFFSPNTCENSFKVEEK